jgi:hypothetical protein
MCVVVVVVVVRVVECPSFPVEAIWPGPRDRRQLAGTSGKCYHIEEAEKGCIWF